MTAGKDHRTYDLALAILNEEIVITSYSIHYTKLYECSFFAIFDIKSKYNVVRSFDIDIPHFLIIFSNVFKKIKKEYIIQNSIVYN